MSPSPTPDLTVAPPERTPWSEQNSRSLLAFLKTETGSAGLLLAATIIALVWVNSPWKSEYTDLWHVHISINVGGWGIDETLVHWVNDGLMAFFFYVVGLEIRRELELGELRDKRAAAIPAIAALAGMVVPALLYIAINAGGPGQNGWGIVMATDIAFVLGAVAILGNRIPTGVRVFLLTLAIVDDIGAIIVIATFYTSDINLVALAEAAATLVVILLARRYGPPWNGPMYFAAGLVLWVFTLESGIHPTIAGVLMGLLTAVYPPQPADVNRAASLTRLFTRRPEAASGRAAVLELRSAVSPNERFQKVIHPWTSYVVIPIFALANAGVPLGGDVLSRALTSPITIGVVVGLVVGKTLGVSVASLGAVRLKVGPLPDGVDRGHVVGAAGLAGIGFTVSLFVADLAFKDPVLIDEAKIGVLVASLLAAVLGLVALWQPWAPKPAAGSAPLGADGAGAPARPLAPAVDALYDRISGSDDAPHTLVFFVDYECPHTRAFGPVLADVLDQAGDRARLVVRQLPNEDAHPGAVLAAESALAAAAADNFWPMHEALLAHPVGNDLGPADLLDLASTAGLDPDRIADDLRGHVRLAAVRADLDGARRSGVPGTPTLFLDGERLDSAYDAESLLKLLRS